MATKIKTATAVEHKGGAGTAKKTTATEELLRIGIDLGNAYSVLAALIVMGRIDCYIDLNDEVAIPSIVAFGDRGEIYVGYAALNIEKCYPRSSVRYFKRVMAENHSSGNPLVIFSDAQRDYTAEDVTVLFAEKLKTAFEKQLGKPVGYAVVTVPANYPDVAKVRTRDAFLRAGFLGVRLIPEPVAAATAYGLEKEIQGTILIVDLGGGTFDVTVLEIKDGKFEVLASGGEQDLGGIDFDGALIDHVEATYMEQYAEAVDIRSDKKQFLSVNEAVQQAKHALSATEVTQLICIVNGKQLSIQITRAQFEAMIEPYLAKMEPIIREVAQQARVAMDKIDYIVLVGGSTKIPAVRSRVASVTGQQPMTNINPSTAVGIGAAMLAQIAGYAPDATEFIDRERRDNELSPILRGTFSDVVLKSPHPLGIEAMQQNGPGGGKMVNAVVYPGNAALGQELSRRFRCEDAYQTDIHVKVLQGKAGAPVENCTALAEFDVPITNADTNNDCIEIILSYSIDGLVIIKVRDLKTGGIIGGHEFNRGK